MITAASGNRRAYGGKDEDADKRLWSSLGRREDEEREPILTEGRAEHHHCVHAPKQRIKKRKTGHKRSPSISLLPIVLEVTAMTGL